ncbi:solute carrier family 25 member 45-like isoform X1 [Panulirus ornatus]|uniref:solute carrier family 25 member 45-like isoform X1 n=1 Tax=Panulirus ornatus TaxID=150431 RepID=UPI003A8581AE
MDKEFWFDFVAGWVGGCSGLLVGHPLDTVKVRQQTLKKVSATGSVINVFKHEGWRGFYKGMGFPLLTSGILNSLFFGVYGNTLRWVSNESEKPSYSSIFLAGCAGGVAQLVVACPVDLVKIKMQMQTGSSNDVWGKHYESNYRGPTACFRDLYQKGGISGCFAGLRSMILRDVPSFGLYVVIYDAFINRMSGSEQCAGASTLIFCGGMAGVISWASILPLDVVKSRIQADCSTNPQYKGSWDCFVKSYYADGLQVFTRGFWMMSLRAFPTNGAIFLGYVTCLSVLRNLAGDDAREEIPIVAPELIGSS